MNPRDADPLTIPEDYDKAAARFLEHAMTGSVTGDRKGVRTWIYVEDQERPLIWSEPRDRPGITIPLLLAIVVVVVVALAVWGGTR